MLVAKILLKKSISLNKNLIPGFILSNLPKVLAPYIILFIIFLIFALIGGGRKD